MLEQLIIFFKNIPRHMRHSGYRIVQQRQVLLLTLFSALMLIILLKIVLNVFAVAEITQATMMYRLVGLIAFSVIFIAIWMNYKNFPRDYYVTRHFNSNPMLHILISSAVYSLILSILLAVIGCVKPVNADTLIKGVIFYTVMTYIFIVLLSYLLGLVRVIYIKLDKIYFVIAGIAFVLLPIILIRATLHGSLVHILMLNPLYYLVNGFQESVIVGSEAFNHMGYHFYFICWLGFISVIAFALNDYVSQLRPNEHIQ